MNENKRIKEIKNKIKAMSTERRESVIEILERIQKMREMGMTERNAELLNAVLKLDIILGAKK